MNQTERRAIEALRAGVPNRDAVRHLGTDQRAIEKRFLDALSQVASERRVGRELPGLLVSGDFGAGKSHLLEWLQHIALEQNFACSRVVISKESPLGQPHRIFRAAMNSLRAPELVGGLEEIAHRLRPDSQAYAEMSRQVQSQAAGFDPLFQATLLLHERVSDPETLSKIIAFWRGDRIDVGELRRGVRALGSAIAVRQRRIADLALPRFRFAANLIAGAGYSGWVILLDELELVANFSLTSRAGSYATLATLLGLLTDACIPGVFVVGAVTTDFGLVVFDGRRDQERIPQRLHDRHQELLPAAEAGMQALTPTSAQHMSLEPQDSDALARTHATVRALYATAYGWPPPPDGLQVRERSMRMRQYVRDWITRWDLVRLDPTYQPDILTEDYVPDLRERPELEPDSAEAPAENDSA